MAYLDCMTNNSVTSEKPLLPTAELIHEALEQLDWSGDARALAERVSRLGLGLPAEDEFSALLSWLGNCRLVHKLDQYQSPQSSKGNYQVPDLLTIFSHDGHDIPVLIEVKTSNDRSLNWKPQYYEALRRYGEILGLPVLVAWKHYSHWTLFELAHFERPSQNYKIAFSTAAIENLMGILAGDWRFKLRTGVGIHILFKKVEKVSEAQDGDTRREEWILRVDDAYFTDGEGTKLKDVSFALWQLFLSTPPEDKEEIGDETVAYEAIISEETELQWSHRAFVMLLHTYLAEGKALRWREVLRTLDSHITAQQLLKVAEQGLKHSIVKYIFHMQPRTMPGFLKLVP